MQFDAALLDSVYRWGRSWPVCGSMGRQFHHRSTLSLVEKVPSPAEFLELSTEYVGAGYGPCVDRRGVDATFIPHLDN